MAFVSPHHAVWSCSLLIMKKILQNKATALRNCLDSIPGSCYLPLVALALYIAFTGVGSQTGVKRLHTFDNTFCLSIAQFPVTYCDEVKLKLAYARGLHLRCCILWCSSFCISVFQISDIGHGYSKWAISWIRLDRMGRRWGFAQDMRPVFEAELQGVLFLRWWMRLHVCPSWAS